MTALNEFASSVDLRATKAAGLDGDRQRVIRIRGLNHYPQDLEQTAERRLV